MAWSQDPMERQANNSDNKETMTLHNRRQATIFDQVADEFLKPIPEDIARRTEFIVASAKVRRGHAVLDVGTGAGALISYILSARPAKVVACDISEEMLKRARRRFDGLAVFVNSDIVDLPPALGPFDRVFCNAVFGNFFNPHEVLRSIRHLLKPRGLLVISHPMGKGFVHGLMTNYPEMVLHDLPDEGQLVAMATATGFRLKQFIDEPDLYIAIVQPRVRLGTNGAESTVV